MSHSVSVLEVSHCQGGSRCWGWAWQQQPLSVVLWTGLTAIDWSWSLSTQTMKQDREKLLWCVARRNYRTQWNLISWIFAHSASQEDGDERYEIHQTNSSNLPQPWECLLPRFRSSARSTPTSSEHQEKSEFSPRNTNIRFSPWRDCNTQHNWNWIPAYRPPGQLPPS